MSGTLPHWLGPAVPFLIGLPLLVVYLTFFVLVILAIMKVFQISRDVKEIKARLLAGTQPPRPSA